MNKVKMCKQYRRVNVFRADRKAGLSGCVDRLSRRSFFACFASILAGAMMFSATGAVASDADYPNQAVKWVVPYSAGASNDSVARILAAKLTQMWNQPVIIENKAGAGGTIGAAQAAKAPADGYTLLMTNPGSNVNAFALRESNSYAQEDFKHVGQLGWAPIVLVTRSDFASDSVKGLVSLAKEKPGSLTAGSSGIGGSSHLALELFKLKSGTDVLHVPYKGAANAINDLVGGQIDMVFVTPASVSSLVQSGKLKVLGVASEQRIESAPDVPTMQEQDVPGFNMKIWFGVSVPAGTPDSIVNRVNQDMRAAVQDPQVKAQIESLGLQIETSSPQAFAQTIERDIAVTKNIAVNAGITAR
ncbi:Bug family tripartite tricarboxylate transporter substrate binding protein [Orrella marina]|uniref:Bug family tripartite tricarboxylate transporter substrate binding protein n=1 Tax=Orrella marina TaxID=2163011 RepID=UPI00131F1912|nr:tripartite tricarboxylate transporter substrate binding protein [Orrella marina]